jgi:heme-degrading monooxygenase HmoA
MEKRGQAYSSGNWLVQQGNEEDFIARWTTFAEWSLENAPGAEAIVLVQDSDNPRHFLSLGAWVDEEAISAWRQMPTFRELLGACRELCEEFDARFYTLASAPSEHLGE